MSHPFQLSLSITADGCQVDLNGETFSGDLEWIFDSLPGLLGRALVEAGVVEPGELLAEMQGSYSIPSGEQLLEIAEFYLSALRESTVISARRVQAAKRLLCHALNVSRLNGQLLRQELEAPKVDAA